jgi:two-component system, NtrC family, sensor histidine kinase HydH
VSVVRWTVVGAFVALGLLSLVLAIAHVLDHDRQAAEDELAHDKLDLVTEAARGLGAGLERLGDELELAPMLTRTADTRDSAARALGAITASHPAYLLLEVYESEHDDVRATAPAAPAVLVASANPIIARLIELAQREPGELLVSAGLRGKDDASAWYRVIARRDPEKAVTVAAVVDMREVIVPPAMLHAGSSRLLVLGSHGVPAPASDPEIASVWQAPALSALSRAIATARGLHPTTAILDSDAARVLGLPSARAIAAAAPIQIDGLARANDAGLTPWVLALVTSTDALQARHDALVTRIAIGLSLGLLLLSCATFYIVRNARRSASLAERLRQAERLAHLTEKAEKILDHIPSGVLALDERGMVTAANRWFTVRGIDVTGKALHDGFTRAPAADVERVVALVERARATATPQTLSRAPLRLLGEDACLDVHAVPLANAAPDLATLVVIEDVGELQRAEDRLLRSEKLATAGQLSAGIAHELGTPLNVARGRIEMVLARLDGDDTQAANLRIATDQIDLVTRQIQQLLDYVRPDQQRSERVALLPTLRGVAELVEGHAASRAVSVRVDAEQALPHVCADPSQLQQVLVNLVVNAIDACERGGHVTLRARPRAAAAAIEIVDDGHGIAAEDRAHVFDPFFTTKKRGLGTGLGLWVVAQVARAHDAEIEVESTVGVGTTFRIVWPDQRGAASA